MGKRSAKSNSDPQNLNVIYLDENSINRALAELLLQNAGFGCCPVETFGALIDAVNHRPFDVLVLELRTAEADPEGFALAQREPRFREMPLVVVGDDEGRAAALKTARFVPLPLDPERFIAVVAAACGERDSEPQDPISRAALLARVGGRTEAAAELLVQFLHDFAGHDVLVEEAARRGDREKVDFLLRNLRSAAGAIGADELYRTVETIQREAAQGAAYAPENLKDVLRRAVKNAAALHSELGSGVTGFLRKAIRDTAEAASAEHGDEKEKTAKPTLLAVDDSATNRLFIIEKLSDEYVVVPAVDGSDAVEKARGRPTPALILLDVTMPGIDGYETCRLLKEDPRTRSIPIIFLTSLAKEEDEARGFSLGAVDYIRKPFSVPILKARVRTQLELLRYREYLETLVEDRTRALRETQKEVIFRLAQAAEYRDNETGSHIKRIGYFSAIMAERLGFPRAEVDTIFYASSMHDIGKIGIPDHILRKPGKLTDEEWKVMKQHPTIGAGLLEGHPSDLLRIAARIARTHHEKWDGTGYPAGLAAEEIPMEGRIVAVCDVFDALLSERPYKPAWTADEALDEINRLSGRHFDPLLVRTFNDAFPEFVSIKKRFER